MQAQRIAEQPDAGDETRAHLHAMWSSVAGSWGAHADFIDERAAPLSERLLELAAPQPGERVLDLASGPGGVGLVAAQRLAPAGEVVLSDVAPEMIAIAAARAAALGLGNVRTRVLDLEAIDEPDACFDVVLCREGLMFAVDHARALGEIRRVLRPGGRAAISVWGPRARNPWLGLVLDAVGEQLGRPVPPPGIPGPFALEDAAALRSLLADAGLSDVALSEQSVPLRSPSFEDWWGRTSALAGPLAKLLASLPAEAIAAIAARVREAAAPYEVTGALEFPGVALVAFGRRSP
jgi:SAM-dependent methyltransferase